MQGARNALVQRAQQKLTAVSNKTASYLRRARRSKDPTIKDKCLAWFQPFFQLPDAVLSSLELSNTGPVLEPSTGPGAAPGAEPDLETGENDNRVKANVRADAQVSKARYYFDQETLADKNVAYVEFNSRRKKQLEVVCPAKTHLRRRRYIRVLGTALERHMSHHASFTVKMSPIQLNCVVALGCLGYYITPVKGSKGTSVRAKRVWPVVKSSSVRKVLPPAIKYQFATIWHRDEFWSSYYDLIKGVFRFAQKPSAFKSEVATLKLRDELVLKPVDFDILSALPNSAAVYGEYRNSVNGPLLCFFGTVGDLLSKHALLPDESEGKTSLDQMQVYYMDPAKPVALANYLNRVGKSMPHLDPASALQKLPESALANFVKIWTLTTVELVKRVMAKDEDFVQRIVEQVPVGVRELVVPRGGPHPTVNAELVSVFRAMAMYPSLTGTLMD